MQDIARDVMGLGPIEQFLADPTVSEIMVNGRSRIYVERRGHDPADRRAASSPRTHLRRVIDAHRRRSVGRRIDESSPMVDARARRRVPRQRDRPAARRCDGSILTIRKFAKDPLTVDDLVGIGTAHRAGGRGSSRAASRAA